MTRQPRRRTPEPAGAGAGGWTLVELMAVLGVLAVAAAVTAPPAAAWARRQRLEDAARRLSARLTAARWQALTGARACGLALDAGPGGALAWTPVRDGDGDGLRRADLADGVDAATGPRESLQQRAPGVRAGVLAGRPVPRLPPLAGLLDRPEDPVKFGSSDLISFSPAGGATAGSLYLTDGVGMAALVVNGITGRTRLFRFDGASGAWKELL